MPEKRWFWATLTLSSITIVSVVLAAWELVENRLFRDANYITLHYLYVTRGVASSLLLAFWADLVVAPPAQKEARPTSAARGTSTGDCWKPFLVRSSSMIPNCASSNGTLRPNACTATLAMQSWARASPFSRREAAELEDYLQARGARRPRARCRDLAPA